LLALAGDAEALSAAAVDVEAAALSEAADSEEPPVHPALEATARKRTKSPNALILFMRRL
jgi:hypothetical protein